MKPKELERLLETADELVEARATLARAEALEAEIDHDQRVLERVPELTASLERCRAAIERLARELERQWVDQGPLVSAWQRAVELDQLAVATGAADGLEREEAERARQQVETARLQTRDVLAELSERRCGLADVVLAAPFELPTPPPVRDDGRPEAGRRDALGLIELAADAIDLSGEEGRRAQTAIADARAELAGLGGREAAADRVASLQAQLPAELELPSSAPPSAAARLQRAGVRTVADTRA